MTTKDDNEQDRIVRQGTAAWARLKKDKSWTDWLTVGEALRVGREHAMYQAGTNRPEGKGYSQEFGRWLTKNKLDDMDKSDRSKLFTVMENLPAIEGWRATLTPSERMRLNHPATVLRNWQRATAVPNNRPAKPNKDDAPRWTNVAVVSEHNPGTCSFCGKAESDVEKLFGGTGGSAICNACAENFTSQWEKAKEDARAIRWYEAKSDSGRGRSAYHDDERGPDYSRLQISPVRSGYQITDVMVPFTPIGKAHTVEEAKKIAQDYADENPTPSWWKPDVPDDDDATGDDD